MSFLFTSRSSSPSLFSILDLGTHKTCCMIAKPSSENVQPLGLELLGMGYHGSKGLKVGRITDLEAFEESIIESVQAAERHAKETIQKVYVSLPSSFTKSSIIKTEIDLTQPLIDDNQIRRLLYLTQNQNSNYQTIHVFPLSYSVDDIDNIKDPKGMVGKRLAVNLHTVSVPITHLKNIQHAIGRCQLDVIGYVASPYASSLATLVDDEKDLGVTLLDIGGEQTGICCFFDGNVIAQDYIPYGGVNITNDIARGLSTPKAQAERLKNLYGTLVESDDKESLYVVPIERNQASHPFQVPKSLLSHIIEARIEEIFELIKKILQQNNIDISQKIILTGGTSQIHGIEDFSKKIFNAQVRLGYPKKITGHNEDTTHNPMFSSAIGTLLYAVQDQTDRQLYKLSTHRLGLFERVQRWLKKN